MQGQVGARNPQPPALVGIASGYEPGLCRWTTRRSWIVPASARESLTAHPGFRPANIGSDKRNVTRHVGTEARCHLGITIARVLSFPRPIPGHDPPIEERPRCPK